MTNGILISKLTLTAMTMMSFVHVLPSIAEAGSAACSQLFSTVGKVTVVAPNEPDLGAAVGGDARIIARLAKEMGLAVPPHQVNIVPSGQINLMTIGALHPPPHWIPGRNIVADKLGAGGDILEFVVGGCHFCRAFYSASTQRVPQRSVLFHVAGHNDFSSTNVYSTIRPGDSMLASNHLARFVGQAYREEGHARVSLFYQYLESFEGLQDFVTGTFEDPAQFSPVNLTNPLPVRSTKTASEIFGALTNPYSNTFIAPPRSTAGGEYRQTYNDWHKTASVLQAFTALLPPETPIWSRQMLELYEHANRTFPFITQTQITNEGWATIQMTHGLAPYAPWRESADFVEYAQVIGGHVSRINPENPYWLGSSGWINLYEQFVERPEIKPLTPKEQTQRFIAYARDLYANKNDSQWAEIAFDRRWVEKHKFMLYRSTQEHEIDPNSDPAKQGMIVLTRDWKRIQRFVISRYVNMKFMVRPKIELMNPAKTPGVLRMRDQNTLLGFDIEMGSAAKTLFVITQVMKKPASLEALFEREGQQRASWGRISVDYSGRAQFQWLEEAKPDPPPPRPPWWSEMNGPWPPSRQDPGERPSDEASIAEALTKAIDDYRANNLTPAVQTMSDIQMRQWAQLSSKVGDANSTNAASITSFAPYAAGAIREYLQTVQTRLKAELDRWLKGEGNGQLTSKGLKLSVLPEVPMFAYSTKGINRKQELAAPAPVDRRDRPTVDDFFLDTFGSKLGVGSFVAGDKFSPRKRSGGGGGGKGKGDAAEPGEGDGEPSDVIIPLNLLGEALATEIALPNPRKVRGQIEDVIELKNGVVQRPGSEVQWDETFMAALDKARAVRKAKGLPHDTSVPVSTLVREAMRMLEPADIHIPGIKLKPVPDMEAVVVVNVDMTASMEGERLEAAKNFLYNFEALLLTKYKKVTVRYIGFTTIATEFTREEIFSKFLNGGTSYVAPLKLAKEILDPLPNSKVAKYVLTLGDAETNDQKRHIDFLVNELGPDLQYAAIGITNHKESKYALDMVKMYEQARANWPWLGAAIFQNQREILPVMRELFPKNGKPGTPQQ